MQNDKIGLFDLLAFLIPGGTLLYVLLYCAEPFIPNSLYYSFNLKESNYWLVPYFFISYFLGHVVSFIGRKWEYKGLGEKNAWTIYLQNLDRAKALNELSIKQFGYSFMTENEVDVRKSSDFFDDAYVFLETKQKSDKIALLMAQFGFFRNATVVFAISAAALALMMVLCKGFETQWALGSRITVQHYIAFALFLFGISMSKRLMRERKRWMMTATYQNFSAFFSKPFDEMAIKK